jgi:hypothetical protein
MRAHSEIEANGREDGAPVVKETAETQREEVR